MHPGDQGYRHGERGLAGGGFVNSLTRHTRGIIIDNVNTVSVREAKTHLSRLLRQVEAGEEVVITLASEPVARPVAVEPKRPRQAGRLKHAITIGEDLEAPLPDSFWTGED